LLEEAVVGIDILAVALGDIDHLLLVNLLAVGQVLNL
jgi:hypothetical protein